MTYERQLAQNTAIQIIGKTLATILGVATVAILARYLGTAGYGQFTIALSFLSIFAVIVDFGLTLTTTQMISEHQADEPTLLGNLLTLRLVSAVVFLALAPAIALFFPYDRVILGAIGVGTLSFFFGTTAQMLTGVYQKRLVMWRAVAAELGTRALVLAGVALAPMFGLSIIGIMWLLVAGNAVQLFLMFTLSRSLIRFRLRASLKIWRDIIKRSWPIGASIFFNLIYLRGDIVFLSLFRPDTEVGLYGAAYKVVDVVAAIPVMYMGLTLPLLIQAYDTRSKERFASVMQSSFDFFAILAFPILFGTIAAGEPIMTWVAGADFEASGRVLTILGPAISVVFFGALFGHAIVAVQKQKPMTWGYLAVAIFTVAGYLFWIPRYGMWAAAWLTLGSELAIAVLTFLVVKKVSGYLPNLAMVWRALSAGLVMFTILSLGPPMHAVLIIAVGTIIYALTLTALGGPKPKDILGLFLPEKPPINM